MRIIIRSGGHSPDGRRFSGEVLRNTCHMAPLLLAHAGHWLLWVLYLVPVLIVLVATIRAFREERSSRREEG